MTSHRCISYIYIYITGSLCCQLKQSKPFVICCIFPEPPSSAGFKRRGQESGRAGEWTMFTLARPARGSAVATATAQVEWSASVMRDTMVGYKQHIIFKLLNTLTSFFLICTVQKKSVKYSRVCFNFTNNVNPTPNWPAIFILPFSSLPLCFLSPQQVTTAPSPAVTCPAPSRITLSQAVCLRRAGS